MEEVIAIHGGSRLVIGAKPTTIVDCYKQIFLTLGEPTNGPRYVPFTKKTWVISSVESEPEEVAAMSTGLVVTIGEALYDRALMTLLSV